MARRKGCLTKKELKSLIKDMGYTYEEMQAFWDELVQNELNSKVCMLAKNGINWDSLTESVIRTIPTLKEDTLRKRQEQAEAEREEAERAKREAEEKAYYEEHFEDIMLEKLESGEGLTESELKTLIFEYEVHKEYGDKLRWVRPVFTVFELNGKYFGVNWFEGLTEMQENEFNEQPFPVEKRIKVVEVEQWVSVDKVDKGVKAISKRGSNKQSASDSQETVVKTEKQDDSDNQETVVEAEEQDGVGEAQSNGSVDAVSEAGLNQDDVFALRKLFL